MILFFTYFLKPVVIFILFRQIQNCLTKRYTPMYFEIAIFYETCYYPTAVPMNYIKITCVVNQSFSSFFSEEIDDSPFLFRFI